MPPRKRFSVGLLSIAILEFSCKSPSDNSNGGDIDKSQPIGFWVDIFKAYLIDRGVDTDKDGNMSIAEAAEVQAFDIGQGDRRGFITDFSSIEYFIGLDNFTATNHSAAHLNLSSYEALSLLILTGGPHLASLVLGDNPHLWIIRLNRLGSKAASEAGLLSKWQIDGMVQFSEKQTKDRALIYGTD